MKEEVIQKDNAESKDYSIKWNKRFYSIKLVSHCTHYDIYCAVLAVCLFPIMII